MKNLFTVEMNISPMKTALTSLGLEPDGSAQKFFTNELTRLSDSYVPMNNGVLKDSVLMEKDGTGIIYNTPYARYHWYGKLAVDPVTGKGAFFKEGYGFWSRPNTKKVITNTDMQYQGAPIRGPRWIERCFIDNKALLIKSTEDFIERNNK